MMWLAQGYEPSYRTINRFRVHPEVKEILRQCFVQFRAQLVQANQIDEEAIFIDGTKIEANANKFTFVWRKSIERYNSNLIKKSNEMYDELLAEEIIPEMKRESSEELTVEELEEMLKHLDHKVEKYDQAIEASKNVSERKELRSARKKPKQDRKALQDYIVRKQKYQNDMLIFDGRNSYSKTDHDATFMRMKDDYMRNGQLKAAYNVQIATEGQYTLAYDVFPNPGDTRTLIPFLNNSHRMRLITYNQYRKEKKKKFKNDTYQVANWEYNQNKDIYICPNGQTIHFSHLSNRTDKYGFTRTYKVYESKDCSSCLLRAYCTRTKENNRRIYYNEKWEKQKAFIRDILSNETTGEIYGKRKIDVEPVFGFLKANLGFARFSVRSKQKVEQELGFAFMAVNLRKFTAMNRYLTKYNQRKNSFNYHFVIIETVFIFFS